VNPFEIRGLDLNLNAELLHCRKKDEVKLLPEKVIGEIRVWND